MEEIRIPYRQYKAAYSDCDTVSGSYDEETKTICVAVPDGRMKKSGARGKTFKWMAFNGVENETRKRVRCTIKATCRENAIKRLLDGCTWDIA